LEKGVTHTDSIVKEEERSEAEKREAGNKKNVGKC